ncbi:MAG: hypothetical protein U0807_12155 [Candidatus Binatia bacterium]
MQVATTGVVVGRQLRRKLGYALVGVTLGGLGIGWHGRPSDEVIVAAIRARSAEHAQATITLVDVERNWLHEILGSSTSRFLVTAIVTPPGGPGVERCFGVEPDVAGTALALGPYAGWRCDYPF